MSKVGDLFESMEYGPAPESASLALEWIQRYDGRFGFFIGGEWISAGSHFDSVSPRDGRVLAQIGQAGANDGDAAVSAARAALPGWQALSGFERGKVLYALGRAVQRHSRLFSVLESLDNGKPIRESRDVDIPLVARHFTHHAGWAQIIDDELAETEPVGVCGQIIPWNFPLLMLAWKIAPALACGNTVVLKPAEFTSLTALLFGQICEEVGVPAGVVNILTGDGSTGAALVEHPGVDKIAFTGSTEVGQKIRRATAGTGKKLSLELGGKSPFIVFEDADLDAAVEGLVDAIWFNQGQVCCAGSRLLVQEGVAKALYAKIRERMSHLRVGDPLDKAVDVGAIVDATQLERIEGYVKLGEQEGATVFQTGSCPREGFFYPPTLLTDVAPSSTVAQEEIFGPVLVSMTFRTPAEAVALANNTVFGLAATIFTENLNLAHDIAAKVKAGVVWINGTNFFDAAAGFGGYKMSGFGREGGREGLYEYRRVKPLPEGASFAVEAPEQKPAIDRTHKLFIGGKQARPDSGYSLTVAGIEVPRGNRKDVRNAVEAAQAALGGWAGATGHLRSQILAYIGENLAAERSLIVPTLADPREFDLAVERCFLWAAHADKIEGTVHPVLMRAMVYTRPEPIGVCGAICPDGPALLGFLDTVLPLVAAGNTVVAVPSRVNPLPALEFYRIFDSSDLPAGVVNIVTGTLDEVAQPLADHLGVDALWNATETEFEAASAENLKRTWTPTGIVRPAERIRQATQIKNIWVPYGA